MTIESLELSSPPQQRCSDQSGATLGAAQQVPNRPCHHHGSLGEQDSQSSIAEQQAVTQDTSFSGAVKRRKGRKLADG
jgi:hypothetical protein